MLAEEEEEEAQLDLAVVLANRRPHLLEALLLLLPIYHLLYVHFGPFWQATIGATFGSLTGCICL